MTHIHYWMLNPDHTVEPAPLDENDRPTDEYLSWCFGDKPNRIVQQTDVNEHQWVSTVFLGIDHSFGHGPPVLFESMVFTDGKGGDMMNRYCTWDEAVAGHKRMCESLQSGLSREELEKAKAIITPLLKE